MSIEVRNLACGMPLVVERSPGLRSVSASWLLPAGSAQAPVGRLGSPALAAELIFRGAGPLGARAQADAMDAAGLRRGVSVDATAMRIDASFVGSRLADALPLLAAAARAPQMPESAFEPSRQLCQQSLRSLHDEPQRRVVLTAIERRLPSPVNRSGYGDEACLAADTRDGVAAWWAQQVRPGSSVLSLAGDVDISEAADLLDVSLQGWSGAAPPLFWGGSSIGAVGRFDEAEQTNQSHIAVVYGAPSPAVVAAGGVPASDPAWVPSDELLERVVTAVLSGGMSGRLFTEVRERRSLCYSVYASYAGLRHGPDACGWSTAYVGTSPDRASEALDVLTGELTRINTPAGRVTPEELARVKVGMRSKLVMGGESTAARASALAHDRLMRGAPRSLAGRLAAIDAVTLDQIDGYLARRSSFQGSPGVVVLGPAQRAASAPGG